MNELDVRQMIQLERERLADKLFEFRIPGFPMVITAELINPPTGNGDNER